jgi:uncharacterized SAM-dependent methyltransferase
VERPVSVIIHPSCFPDRARAAYLESFRSRRMNHRFHYESEKQAQQWLALHEAYSPARTDDDCLRMYERAFSGVSRAIESKGATVISFGCGGGQKDLSLLKSLESERLAYVPSDVSPPLAVTAHLRAVSELVIESRPAVVDISTARDLPRFVDSLAGADGQRIFAFFGMLPNFEPDDALTPLASVLREDDLLVLSANLAPGPEYELGVKKILPLYDNGLTRRWLATSLIDAGLDVARDDIRFSIEPANDLLRVEANYVLKAAQNIEIDNQEFSYKPGDVFRLFFSYRHTTDRLTKMLRNYSIEILRAWTTQSEEEGVFLCRKLAFKEA